MRILDKEIVLREIMKPISMKDNIKDLKEVGFNIVECIWKQYNFVCILAIK